MINQILWIHWISHPFKKKCIVNTAHWQISFEAQNRRQLCDLRWADSDSTLELLSGIKCGIGSCEEMQEIPIVWYSYKHYWIYQNLDKIQYIYWLVRSWTPIHRDPHVLLDLMSHGVYTQYLIGISAKHVKQSNFIFNSSFSTLLLFSNFLPSATKLRRLCFYRRVSVHRRGGGVLSQHVLQVLSQHALQQVSQGGVLSQHALQVVSQHALQHVPGGWGCLVRGGVCSQGVPAPGGCLLGGGGCLIPGGCLLPGEGACSQWGCLVWGLVSQHALRQTPPPETATTADGTHPTGMHSCLLCRLI